MTEETGPRCSRCAGPLGKWGQYGVCMECLDGDVVDPVDRSEEIRDRDDSGRHRYAKRDDSTKSVVVETSVDVLDSK